MTFLGAWEPLLLPHVVAVALCAARLLPIVFLCPLFGGQTAPVPVRLSLVLSLALALHLSAGVPAPHTTGVFSVSALAARELALGTSMGLVAAVPFDAARMGGRFIDLFRGSSAEAVLPQVGSHESAAGDLLHQMLVAAAAASAPLPLALAAIWKSFAVLPLGAFTATPGWAQLVVQIAGGAVATGLAIGAPIAGVVLAVDLLLGLLARGAPQLRLQDVGTPLRILGGGALLWLGVGVLAERLLELAQGTEGALFALLKAAS